MNGRRDLSSAIFFYLYLHVCLISVKKCFPTENLNHYHLIYKSKKYFYILANNIFKIPLWNCIKCIRGITLQSIV
jgi:hypothetical protein